MQKAIFWISLILVGLVFPMYLTYVPGKVARAWVDLIVQCDIIMFFIVWLIWSFVLIADHVNPKWNEKYK